MKPNGFVTCPCCNTHYKITIFNKPLAKVEGFDFLVCAKCAQELQRDYDEIFGADTPIVPEGYPDWQNRLSDSFDESRVVMPGFGILVVEQK